MPTDTSHNGQMPETYEVQKNTDPMQALAIKRDSGGPLLIGKAPYQLAGIFTTTEVFSVGNEIIHGQQKWVKVAPHIDWIKSVVKDLPQ